MEKGTWSWALKVSGVFVIASLLAMGSCFWLCVRENEARAQEAPQLVHGEPPTCALAFGRSLGTTCTVAGTDRAGIITLDASPTEESFRVNVLFDRQFANTPTIMLSTASSSTPDAVVEPLLASQSKTKGFAFQARGYGHYQWYFVVSDGDPTAPQASPNAQSIFTTYDSDTHKITSEINDKGDIYAHSINVDGSAVLTHNDLPMVWIVSLTASFFAVIIGALIAFHINAYLRHRYWKRVRAWKAKQPKISPGGPHRTPGGEA